MPACSQILKRFNFFLYFYCFLICKLVYWMIYWWLILFTLTYCLELCILLGDVLLLASNIFPRTYREIFVIMKEIGMDYQTIDACTNDHIIYYGQYELENEFIHCEISRYWIDKASKKVSRKVLRYIMIIPCFQQFFRCQSIAQFMDFHAKNRSRYDVLRMPTDGSALNYIKEKWPIFK